MGYGYGCTPRFMKYLAKTPFSWQTPFVSLFLYISTWMHLKLFHVLTKNLFSVCVHFDNRGWGQTISSEPIFETVSAHPSLGHFGGTHTLVIYRSTPPRMKEHMLEWAGGPRAVSFFWSQNVPLLY